MTSRLSGKTVLSAEVTVPRIHAWHADLIIDSVETVSGAVTLDFEGLSFVGTVLRAGVYAGRLGVRMVGGAGGLTTELPARSYIETSVGTVLADILRESGETLSATSDASILAAGLMKWHREVGPASHALVNLLDKVGATFRVLRDGTIWVGVTSYPVVSPTHVLVDEDWVAGIITIAPDAPELEPGTTFLGQKIELVVHRLLPKSLRTEAHITSSSSSLNKFLRYIRRQVDYSRLYPARVAAQNADGTLQIVPDDEKIRAAGLDKVPYRLGVPGTVKVAQGQRVLVGFEAGDPSRSFAIGWGAADADELALLAGTDFVALAALVDANFQAIKDVFTNWITVPQDGGAALKALTGSLLFQSVKASKVKAE